jgi:hypothetical protein
MWMEGFDMRTGLVVLGGIFGLVGVTMAYQSIDSKINYSLVRATILTADQDCYIQNSNRDRVVDRSTEELAYVACHDAPAIATAQGFEPDDVHRRVRFEYQFMSPVDNQLYRGNYERNDPSPRLTVGSQIEVYAHSEQADLSRTNAANWFLDDTGVPVD